MTEQHAIAIATERDLTDLLGLMRAYCDFYETDPGDAELLALSRALIADPEHEGVQLIARSVGPGAAGPAGTPTGFATIFWSWSTTRAARIGVMNDLFVAPQARGQGLADRLIAACLARCVERGAAHLEWQTATDNQRAQAVYARVGATREQWVDYSLPAPAALT